MGSLGQRLVERFDRFQRGQPIAAVIVATVKKFGSDKGGRLAALVSYYGFIALFPLLLVLVTVSSWVLAGHVALQERLLDSALAQFPIVGDQIRDNLGQVQGSGVALLIGLAGTFWGGWGALGSMREAMDTIWAAPGQVVPGFLRSRLRSLVLVVALGAGVVATAASSIAAEALRAYGWIGAVAALAGPFVVALALFAVSFLLLAPIRLRIREVLPGALLAATGWVALQAFGVSLLRHQLRYASALYGVFGLVIGLLGWMYLQAQIAMFAAELNSVLRGRLWPVGLVDSVGHPGAEVEESLAQDA